MKAEIRMEVENNEDSIGDILEIID